MLVCKYNDRERLDPIYLEKVDYRGNTKRTYFVFSPCIEDALTFNNRAEFNAYLRGYGKRISKYMELVNVGGYVCQDNRGDYLTDVKDHCSYWSEDKKKAMKFVDKSEFEELLTKNSISISKVYKLIEV